MDSSYIKTDEASNRFNLKALLFIAVIFVFISQEKSKRRGKRRKQSMNELKSASFVTK